MDPAALAAVARTDARRAACARRRCRCCATSRSKRSKGWARATASPRSTAIEDREVAGRRGQERVARGDGATPRWRASPMATRSARSRGTPCTRACAAPRSTACRITASCSASRSTASSRIRRSPRSSGSPIAPSSSRSPRARRTRARPSARGRWCARWTSVCRDDQARARGRGAPPAPSRSCRDRPRRAGSRRSPGAGAGADRAERRRRATRASSRRGRAPSCASGSRSCRARRRSTSSRSRPPSGKGCRRSTTATHDELMRRFERAARACQKRHAEWKDVERRRARLRELADDAAAAAALEDLPAARKQFAAIRREWHDLGAGDDQRLRRHRAVRRRADAVRGARRRRARAGSEDAARGADARCSSWSAASKPLAGAADLTLKAGERALEDLRAALSAVPPLPSKKDYDEIVKRLKARADRADAEGPGAARRRRVAALGQRRRSRSSSARRWRR